MSVTYEAHSYFSRLAYADGLDRAAKQAEWAAKVGQDAASLARLLREMAELERSSRVVLEARGNA